MESPSLIFQGESYTDEEILEAAPSLDQPSFKMLLDQLNEAFHNDVGLISDDTYHILEEFYEEKFEPYTDIGAEPRGNKVDLPYFLGSIVKLKTQEKLTTWGSRYPAPYLVMDKINGVTLLNISVAGTKRLYTRGKGVRGSDVSHLIPYLRFPNLPQDMAIRGEAVIYKSDYERYQKEFENPLGMISGVVNAKTSFRPDLANLIHFTAFHIMDAAATPLDEVMYLKSLGFEVPYFATTNSLHTADLEAFLIQRRKDAPYEMDGLVIYQNAIFTYPRNKSPENVVAFKIPSETATTTVLEVRWKIKKNTLAPKALIEPVRLVGATVRKATAVNARYVINNNIGPGARVVISRRGEIIPHIEAVLVPSPTGPSLPDPAVIGKYSWDKNQTQFIPLEMTADRFIAIVASFVKVLKIEQFGEQRIRAVVTAGYDSLSKLLKASSDDFTKVFGPVQGPKIYENLHQGVTNVPLAKLMAASNVFPNFGSTRAETILNAFPNLLTMTDTPEELARKIQGIGGFKELAVVFASKLPDFKQWLLDHPEITYSLPGHVTLPSGKVIEVVQAAGPSIGPSLGAGGGQLLPPAQQDFLGKAVVFTNVRSEKLKDEIIARGGKVPAKFRKADNAGNAYLIVKDFGVGSDSERTADERGIEKYRLEDFAKKFRFQL